MKISSKGRYALVATVYLAQQYESGDLTTVLSISKRYGISKIYLEQVFSLLKRGGVLISVKGAQGGYQLARPPKDLTVYDVLSAVELALFEDNDATVPDTAPALEKALTEAVYTALDEALARAMGAVTLEHLTLEAEKQSDSGLMYYI